jgi:hypothetical protein
MLHLNSRSGWRQIFNDEELVAYLMRYPEFGVSGIDILELWLRPVHIRMRIGTPRFRIYSRPKCSDIREYFKVRLLNSERMLDPIVSVTRLMSIHRHVLHEWKKRIKPVNILCEILDSIEEFWLLGQDAV